MIGTKSTSKRSNILSLSPLHFCYKAPLPPKSTRKILLTSSQSTEPSFIVKFVDYLPHLRSRFLFPSFPITLSKLEPNIIMPAVSENSHVLLTGASGFLAARTSSFYSHIASFPHPTSTHSPLLSLSCRHRSTAYRQRIQSPRNCQID